MEALIPTIERMPTVDASDIQDIINRTPNVVTQAQQVAKAVHSQETAELAVKLAQEYQAENDRVNNKYSVLRDFLHKSHKAVTSGIANLVNPREAAIRILKDDGLKRWRMDEEKKRRAEEERLAAEQRKRDEEQKISAAIHLEKENPVLAEAILNSPVMSTPPVIPVQKTKDLGSKKTWSVRCDNKLELVKAIAGGAVPLWAVDVNLKNIKDEARKNEGQLKWAGIVVEEDMDISIRRAVV